MPNQCLLRAINFQQKHDWPNKTTEARNQHDKLTWEEGEWAGDSMPAGSLELK
jgi:hypothetical protein